MRRTESAGVALSLSAFGATLFAWAGLVRVTGTAVRPEDLSWAWPRAWTSYATTPDALRLADLHELLGFLALFSAFALAVAAVGAIALIAAAERARTQEMAVRAALGASPARLRRERVRRRVREAARRALPAAIAAGLALLAALRLGLPAGLRFIRGVDPVIAALAVVAPVAAAAMLAAVPYAWRAAHRPARWLMAGERATRGHSDASTATLIAVLQIGASLALLASAGLLLRHDPGDALPGVPATRGTVAATVRLADVDAHALRALRDSLARDRAIVDVAFASVGTELGVAARDRIIIECGQCYRGGTYMPLLPAYAAQYAADAAWFDVRGLRVLEGHGLETSADEAVAVVNRTLALEFERGRPIGRKIWLDRLDGAWVRVVGIVEDTPAAGLGANVPARPAIYLSATHTPPATGVILARGTEAARIERVLRDTIERTTPDATIVSVEPLAARLARATAPLQWFGRLFLALALLATVLGAIGVAAALRVEMRVRAREIAVRAALGASPRALRRFVLRRTFRLIGAGTAFGIVVALLIGRGLQESLSNVPLADVPAMFAAVAILGAAAITGAIPAMRRAAAISPTEALGE